jgi:hypothetical protein
MSLSQLHSITTVHTFRYSLLLHFLSLAFLLSFAFTSEFLAPTLNPLPLSESESYVTTDSQSATLSWNKVPIWGLRPDINYCLIITVLFLWGALSHERTGLSFVYANGPRQCSPSWVRRPSVSRPYFTVSDLRLPCLSFFRSLGLLPSTVGHSRRHLVQGFCFVFSMQR